MAGGNVVSKEFPDDVSIEEIQKSAKEMALEYVSWSFRISDAESGEGDAH